ncbi:saccharopine dehydrogenase C-terminal domain-containing protein [Raineya orbicola]|uniref:Saccharopine dehydrogenase n=1 Tax=Raineya orbicola TaxID=2016530 RepID=A0A2N3I2S9_9BACT|nr:saccharopine dehydrogenase C-terminal domain-containing protein [Raineya orbicola]PKQ64630.1 Saccharopine dehydrogenase [Raineya orbicola]
MNHKILLLGAGRSASTLIKYLAENAKKYKWQVSVADKQKVLVQEKIKPYPNLKAFAFDMQNSQEAEKLIATNDVIISLLPPVLHASVARICLKKRKHLLTASYVSAEMLSLHQEAQEKGLIFLNEIGLDPGIDHLSAMQILDNIRAKKGKIIGFKSFTGGLIAPEYDTNPWQYKFTWNPQNVVLAGQGVAKYLENGQIKYIPYQQLFKRIEICKVEGYGIFEGYANRDSLSYQQAYGLQKVQTLLRGTLRKQGFCRAWDCFVQLGMTDNQTLLPTKNLTYAQFLATFLPSRNASLQTTFLETLQIPENQEQEILEKFEFLELFSQKPLEYPHKEATPAQILQFILEQKWRLEPQDKDMIVMQHIFDFEQAKIQKQIVSELVVIGENSLHTAMAKTVGLPLGIACKLVVEGKISERGVLLPLSKEIYEPILQELTEFGIRFQEKVIEKQN